MSKNDATTLSARCFRLSYLLSALLIPLTIGCGVASRLDYSHLVTRQGWQRTDRVIETLGLQAGDVAADLGAGDGYFSFILAEAVAPGGRVYAVEIDPDRVAELRREIERRGVENVEVIHAQPGDPGLPTGAVDLVFLCNAYHHFEDHVAYFSNLQRYLAPNARLAIVDGKSSGAATWFLPSGHWLPPGQLAEELSAAGYRHLESLDYLPLQSFDLFGRADRVVSAEQPAR